VAVEIITAADDANERDNGTAFDSAALSLQFSANASAGSRWNSGAIFATAIPQASTINTAALECYFSTASTNDVDATAFCEDVDAPDDYVTTADVTSRVVTTASAALLDLDIGTGRLTITQDVAAPLQEVFDRAGFAGEFNLIVKGQAAPNASTDEGCVTRSVDFTEPWELTIDYTVPAGGSSIAAIAMNYRRRRT